MSSIDDSTETAVLRSRSEGQVARDEEYFLTETNCFVFIPSYLVPGTSSLFFTGSVAQLVRAHP